MHFIKKVYKLKSLYLVLQEWSLWGQLHQSLPVWWLLHWLASIFLVEVGHLLVFYILYHRPTWLIAYLPLEWYYLDTNSHLCHDFVCEMELLSSNF